MIKYQCLITARTTTIYLCISVKKPTPSQSALFSPFYKFPSALVISAWHAQFMFNTGICEQKEAIINYLSGLFFALSLIQYFRSEGRGSHPCNTFEICGWWINSGADIFPSILDILWQLSFHQRSLLVYLSFRHHINAMSRDNYHGNIKQYIHNKNTLCVEKLRFWIDSTEELGSLRPPRPNHEWCLQVSFLFHFNHKNFEIQYARGL
jgi:hypothetical protein